MDDELEDRVLYQSFISHMKLISKIGLGAPLNAAPFAYVWRLFRLYVLRPEVVTIAALLVLVMMYVQISATWSRTLLSRIQMTLSRTSITKGEKLQFFSGSKIDGQKQSWKFSRGSIAAYAVQGRRPRMEDRFVVHEDINNTGVSLFALFDGHGGEFAADYAQEKLVKNLFTKVTEIKKLILNDIDAIDETSPKKVESKPSETKIKLSPTPSSVTDDLISKNRKQITDPELVKKLDALNRPITREVRPSLTVTASEKNKSAKSYIDADLEKINYGQLLTDEILTADRMLIEAAKKHMDVAGTTALLAILEGSTLVVANVGDSRGVMCDSKGNAIPLSFDHKPQQVRERKRIKEAGGFVTFNGVWRVAGILATSRALGDYPLKEKKLVIADPDILKFDLAVHKPLFLIFASDGLWDTFSNEEAIAFVKERLNEQPHFGAKSITLQSYYRGSLDNITVLVIVFDANAFN